MSIHPTKPYTFCKANITISDLFLWLTVLIVLPENWVITNDLRYLGKISEKVSCKASFLFFFSAFLVFQSSSFSLSSVVLTNEQMWVFVNLVVHGERKTLVLNFHVLEETWTLFDSDIHLKKANHFSHGKIKVKHL
jgi:hypothetical protein